MPQSANIAIGVTGRATNPLDLGTAAAPFNLSLALALADGTGANQADRVFHDRRTLAASGTEDLDLAAVLVDAFGTAIAFAKIKAIVVVALAANTNDVQVTRPGVNGVALFLAAADGIAVKPGGAFAWCCPGTGVTVTAGTGDLLTITNSAGGTPVTYDIVIVGTSA